MEKQLIKRLKNTQTDLKANKVKLSRLKKQEKTVFDSLQDARISLNEAELAVKRGGDREALSIAYDKVERLTGEHSDLRDAIKNAHADVEAQTEAFKILQSEAAEWYYPRAMEVVNRYREQEKKLEAIKDEWHQLNKDMSLSKIEICRVPQVKEINPEMWNMKAYSPENDLQNVKKQYGLR
ncbi:MAG TPA: hypothetical protein VK040_00680 [Balneolaceae bacterium]|nr:hypothetical protein [Balneolaceae bacterium]